MPTPQQHYMFGMKLLEREFSAPYLFYLRVFAIHRQGGRS
jgi:hypothetical protein